MKSAHRERAAGAAERNPGAPRDLTERRARYSIRYVRNGQWALYDERGVLSSEMATARSKMELLGLFREGVSNGVDIYDEYDELETTAQVGRLKATPAAGGLR